MLDVLVAPPGGEKVRKEGVARVLPGGDGEQESRKTHFIK